MNTRERSAMAARLSEATPFTPGAIVVVLYDAQERLKSLDVDQRTIDAVLEGYVLRLMAIAERENIKLVDAAVYHPAQLLPAAVEAMMLRDNAPERRAPARRSGFLDRLTVLGMLIAAAFVIKDLLTERWWVAGATIALIVICATSLAKAHVGVIRRWDGEAP